MQQLFTTEPRPIFRLEINPLGHGIYTIHRHSSMSSTFTALPSRYPFFPSSKLQIFRSPLVAIHLPSFRHNDIRYDLTALLEPEHRAVSTSPPSVFTKVYRASTH